MRDDERAEQSTVPLSQNPFREVDQENEFPVEDLPKVDGGACAEHQADIGIKDERSDLVQDGRDPLLCGTLLFGKFVLEIICDFTVFCARNKGLPPNLVVEKARQVYEAAPSFSEREKTVGDEPEHAGR